MAPSPRKNPTTARIGVRIAFYRGRKGLTRADLAGDADVRPTTITTLEEGIGSTTLDTLDKIARALDVPLSALVVEPGAHVADLAYAASLEAPEDVVLAFVRALGGRDPVEGFDRKEARREERRAPRKKPNTRVTRERRR